MRIRDYEKMTLDELMGAEEPYTGRRDWNLEQTRPRATKRTEYEQSDKESNCHETGLTGRKPL